MNLLAVTISRRQEEWLIPRIPWFCFSADESAPDLTAKDWASLRSNCARDPVSWRRYITYLAAKRNRAVELALSKHPETTNVILCDSYYLHQTAPLEKLIADYTRASAIRPLILGGAIWGYITPRVRVSDFLREHKAEWYDKSVPEMWSAEHGWNPESEHGWSSGAYLIAHAPVGPAFDAPIRNLFKVSSVGGISIWPRRVWDEGTRFGVFEDLPHGCEFNYFFEKASLPKYIDFNAPFWRESTPSYRFVKALRCSLHLGRFLQVHRPRQAQR